METFDPSVLDVSWDNDLDYSAVDAATDDGKPEPHVYKQKPFSQAFLLTVDCHELNTKSSANSQTLFKSVEIFIRDRVKAGANDRIGLILYGASDVNPYSIKGICQIFDIATPTVERIMIVRGLSELSTEEFQSKYHTANETRDQAIPLNHAFRYALREFRIRAPATKYARRLIILTARSDPCSVISQDLSVSMHLAEDILRNGCLIDVIPLKILFDWDVFWFKILQQSLAQKQRQDTGDPSFNFNQTDSKKHLLEKSVKELTPKSLTQELTQTTHRQRTLQKTRLILGEDAAIGVNAFVLVMPKKKPTGIKLRGQDRKPVKTNTQWLAESTGEVISRKELISYYDIGNTKVVLDKKAVRLIHGGRPMVNDAEEFDRVPDHPTVRYRMQLLGFTDAACFDRYSLSIRESCYFIYGSNEFISGSSGFMSNLVEVMTLQNKYCYILWQYRAESIPRVFCGVPIWKQYQLPLLLLTAVPYRDDLREPWLHHPLCGELPRLDDTSAANWKNVLSAYDGSMSYDTMRDPAITKFWHGLEILALDEDNVEEFVDVTLANIVRPYPSKATEGCQGLRDTYNFIQTSRKRVKSCSAQTDSKRRNVPTSSNDYEGQTVVALKAMLHQYGLKVAGKKQELIDRLKAYDAKKLAG